MSDITTLRIRIKIGEHEFEGEGSPDVVQTQIAAFIRLLGREQAETNPAESTPPVINKVARINGKVVSLNIHNKSLEQTVLALLLGQRQLRGNPFVAGTEIMAGLRASGHPVGRADHILKRLAMAGHVVVTGKRRLKR